ncbi:armadillo-type protein [Mycena rebaudengoi]|nr:armadillo-type protein [Mycena rebaudengoi]
MCSTIPKEVVSADEGDRECSKWWCAKQWAYSTLGRFGNPSQLPSAMQSEYSAFAQHFVTVFAPEIFAIYLHQVELYVSNQAWLSKKCQYQIFSFFTERVKPKSTWVLLQPHVQSLVEWFVFPQLSFNPTRQLLWESDPVDYIRITVDEGESFTTPMSAATTFLFSVASNRIKKTFMPILGFINTALRSNAPAAQRFGALNMTAALGPRVMPHPDMRGNMEQFVLQFVTPEFASLDAYMRAIACEVLGTVTKERLERSSEENLSTRFRAVAAALDDPKLPVRVQAALALTEMVILARLCDSYLCLIKESLTSDDADYGEASLDTLLAAGDEDKTYAAMGVAKVVGLIVSSIESVPEILRQVQEVIIPVITFTFKSEILDLFDNMYDLVDNLTFKLRSISPNLRPVFELTYELFKSDTVDFLEDAAVVGQLRLVWERRDQDADPARYLDAYWEGRVRALRMRPAEDEEDTRALYKVRAAHEPAARTLEWRDHWLIVRGSTAYLCRDEDRPVQTLSLTDLVQLAGSEALPASSSTPPLRTHVLLVRFAPSAAPTHTASPHAPNHTHNNFNTTPTRLSAPPPAHTLASPPPRCACGLAPPLCPRTPPHTPSAPHPRAPHKRLLARLLPARAPRPLPLALRHARCVPAAVATTFALCVRPAAFTLGYVRPLLPPRRIRPSLPRRHFHPQSKANSAYASPSNTLSGNDDGSATHPDYSGVIHNPGSDDSGSASPSEEGQRTGVHSEMEGTREREVRRRRKEEAAAAELARAGGRDHQHRGGGRGGQHWGQTRFGALPAAIPVEGAGPHSYLPAEALGSPQAYGFRGGVLPVLQI